MPQVDYSHIPFNETAETRRRPQRNNQQTRLDNIIEDITRTSLNRPRINRNDVFRSNVIANNVNSGERSFIQTHPFLFGITVFIMVLAIVSVLISGQNLPLHSVGGDSNYVSQAPSVQNNQKPSTTEMDVPVYSGWEENTSNNGQGTEGQETVIPDGETGTESVNDVNTEVTPSIDEQRPVQPVERKPRWMTDPPDVFMRTKYVR